jgi:hypothetical protein
MSDKTAQTWFAFDQWRRSSRAARAAALRMSHSTGHEAPPPFGVSKLPGLLVLMVVPIIFFNGCFLRHFNHTMSRQLKVEIQQRIAFGDL